MPGKLTLDIETYSPLDIRQVGAYRYAQDPEFQILLLSYHYTDADGTESDGFLDFTAPSEPATAQSVRQLTRMLFDPDIQKWAHNASFEWWCLCEHYKLEMEARHRWLAQWCDTMVHCLYCGLPASLASAGTALRMPEDKAKDRIGKSLIAYFCKPCKPTRTNGGRTRNLPQHDPAKWELFCQYNRQDVTAEMALDTALAAWPVPDDLWTEWREDVWMNACGVGVDTDLVDGALTCAERCNATLAAEAKALTGLENFNSIAQLRGWLAAKGIDTADLSKATVSSLLAGELPADARRVLEIRQQLGKTSNTKYATLQAACGPDKRIRGTLQFYGANRTGRWAGRLLQVQNLPRTYLKGQGEVRQIIKLRDTDGLRCLYGDVNDVLSQMIRTALVPQDGAIFIDADFSAIEARLIAWLAGEDWVLDVFRTTGKIYEATAARIFGIPFETIVKGNPNYAYRQRGKVATLALGYQGGVGAMKRMGGDQLGLDDAGLQDIVDRWRKQNPRIVTLWAAMEDAARLCIRSGKGIQAAPHGVVYRMERSTHCPFPFLTIRLPSGRKLFYADPQVQRSDEDGRWHIYYSEPTNAGWARSETYGGKLTENLTQAVGRDCLAYALHNLRAAGYKVVFHVHDEVVIEIKTQDPDAELERVVKIMSQPPPWADGLPLNAAGWYGDYFTKD